MATYDTRTSLRSGRLTCDGGASAQQFIQAVVRSSGPRAYMDSCAHSWRQGRLATWDIVRQIVGVVAVVLGCPGDDGDLLLRIRKARSHIVGAGFVREVVFKVAGGLAGPVRLGLMIAHG